MSEAERLAAARAIAAHTQAANAADNVSLAPEEQAEDLAETAVANEVPRELRVPAFIEFNELELTRMLDETEQALRERNAPVYQRGGKLVHTFRVNRAPDQDDDIKRPINALGIHEMDKNQLRESIGNHARFWKWGTKDKKPAKVDIATPWPVVSHTASRAERWRFRDLHGIIETPLMRQDGTIITEDGYDSASGLLLDKGGIEYPPIALTPTEQQCADALAILKKPFAQFPFVPDEDSIALGSSEALAARSASRSVVLSGVLTSLTRHLMRAAPMHAISAPSVATGKSYIADGIAIIATGRDAATLTFTGDEAEDEKRIVGALVQGDTVLAYDNVEKEMFGAFICSVLTQESVQVRVLGSTGQHTLSTAVTLTANGNGLTLAGDLADRAVICKIDAGIDKPGEREFSGDFHADMRAQRPVLVAAALTLLRGYIAAGSPWPQGITESRFKSWDRLVRGCLLWLGEPDPYATKDFVASTDSVRESLDALVDAIIGLIGIGKPFSANDLVHFKIDNANGDAGRAMDEALRGVMPVGSSKAPSPNPVSKYLQRNRDRIIGGYVLRGGKDSDTKRWRFVLQPAPALGPKKQGEMAL